MQQQAPRNAISNATNTTLGKTQNAQLTRRRQTAQGFLQIQYGIQRQASRRLGTDRLGLQAQPEHTTQQQVLLNAAINATRLPTTKIQNASPTQEQQTAQDFRQVQSGIPLQAFLRLGTDLRGILQQQVLTIQQPARQSAGTNAERTTLGIKQIRNAKQIPELRTAQDCPQTLIGTRFQPFHRLGTAQAGSQQQLQAITLQPAQLNAASNASTISNGTTQNAL